MRQKQCHVPRRYSDVNIMRCILLNINEHFDTTCTDYHIKKDRFNALIDALLGSGVICVNDNTNRESTIAYDIADIEKYFEWSKSNFYRAIERYVIPFIGVH